MPHLVRAQNAENRSAVRDRLEEHPAFPEREGALHDLAGTAFGKFVLVLLVLGFVAYAAWRALQAVTVRESLGANNVHAEI